MSQPGKNFILGKKEKKEEARRAFTLNNVDRLRPLMPEALMSGHMTGRQGACPWCGPG